MPFDVGAGPRREDRGLDLLDVLAGRRRRRRGNRPPPCPRRRAAPPTARAPAAPGSSSSRRRRSPIAACRPCRTVATKCSPRKTITAPVSTTSPLPSSVPPGWACATYASVRITRKMTSSYRSIFGRWRRFAASSRASGCSPKTAPSCSSWAASGSCRPTQTKPSPSWALATALAKSRAGCRTPSRYSAQSTTASCSSGFISGLSGVTEAARRTRVRGSGLGSVGRSGRFMTLVTSWRAGRRAGPALAALGGSRRPGEAWTVRGAIAGRHRTSPPRVSGPGRPCQGNPRPAPGPAGVPPSG